MERRETLLFYLLGLAALVVVSILATDQIERVEIRPLPTHTPTIVKTPQPAALLPETNRLDCTTMSEVITFRYLPHTTILTHLAGDTLTISGTVYASDFVTPLPNVLIDVWRARPEIQYDRVPPFFSLSQVRTDSAGQYEFTTPKPDRIGNYQHEGEFQPISFHYRLSYQGNCPSSVQLLSADTASPEIDPAISTRLGILLKTQVKPADMMLQGSVDLVLPVSPSNP